MSCRCMNKLHGDVSTPHTLSKPRSQLPYLAAGMAAVHTPEEDTLAVHTLPVEDSPVEGIPAEGVPRLDTLGGHSLAVHSLADHSLAARIVACHQVSQNRPPSNQVACATRQPVTSLRLISTVTGTGTFDAFAVARVAVRWHPINVLAIPIAVPPRTDRRSMQGRAKCINSHNSTWVY